MKIDNQSTTNAIIVTADNYTYTLSAGSVVDINAVTINSVAVSSLTSSSILVTNDSLLTTASYFNDYVAGFGVGLSFCTFAIIIRLARRFTPSGGAGIDV